MTDQPKESAEFDESAAFYEGQNRATDPADFKSDGERVWYRAGFSGGARWQFDRLTRELAEKNTLIDELKIAVKIERDFQNRREKAHDEELAERDERIQEMKTVYSSQFLALRRAEDSGFPVAHCVAIEQIEHMKLRDELTRMKTALENAVFLIERGGDISPTEYDSMLNSIRQALSTGKGS